MNTMQRLDWRNVPLDGRVLIEASAGTGKTWTIAQIYLRLLLERGADVGAVLVCTFSEAAAQELRERLRARLRDAERLLADWPADPLVAAAEPALHEWLQTLVRDEAHARTLCARLRAARLDFDRAPISTIHAFFGRALREHPFDSGAPFAGGELVDEGALLDECFDDFRRRCLQAPPSDRPPYADLLLRNPDAILARVRRLFLHPEAPHRLPAAEDAAGMDAAIAALAAPGTAAELRVAAADSERCFGWIAGRKFPANLLRLADWLDDGRDLQQLPSAICEALGAESLRKARSKRAPDCSADPLLARVLAGIAALVARERVLGARMLEDAFGHCRAAVAALTRARGQRTFASLIDALVGAIDGAGGAALADALFASYPHALIDEFQDTDRRQFRVFERIYAGDRGSLHLIGDPKQSIYGFRGGDVAAYLHASASVGSRAFSIDSNRRSAPGYVGALNALYGCVEQPFAHPRIDYVPVLATGPVDGSRLQIDGDGVPALQLHLGAADGGGDKDDGGSAAPGKPARSARAQAALDACAELVVGLLAGGQRIGAHPLQAADIAVLVPANHHVAQLRRRLAARGVPVAGAGRSSVFRNPLAAELAVVLHAVLHENDESALRAALATQLLGHDSGTLRALEADPQRWDTIASRFEEWRVRWRERGVLALVEALQRQVATRTLEEADGERRLTDLRHLGELLAEGSRHCYGPSGQLAWFNRARRTALEDAAATDEARQLRVESEGARVRLMTLHASKGLQFPLVLLPLAWADANTQADSDLACFHDADGQVVFDLGTAELAEGARVERSEQLQERLRLLYVGLTRAVHACHLFWSPSAPEGNALRHLVDGVVAHHGGDSCAALEAFAAATPGVAATRGWSAGFTRHRPEAAASAPRRARSDLPQARPLYWMHSFSALTRRIGTALESGAGAEDEAGLGLPALALDAPASAGLPADPRLQLLAAMRGPRFGNAVHRVFELFDSSGDEDGLQLLIAQSLRDEGVGIPPALAGTALRRIAELVRRTRGHDLGGGLALAALREGDQVAEFEFHFPLDHARLDALRAACARHGEPTLVPATIGHGRLDGLMTGLIDLVLRFDGRFHVLDYKSNWLGERLADYAPAALQRAMEHAHYPLQALLYTLALHRYLRQRIAGYRYETHMGEAIYLFVRAVGLGTGEDAGAGVWRRRFPADLVDAVDAVFDGDGGRDRDDGTALSPANASEVPA